MPLPQATSKSAWSRVGHGRAARSASIDDPARLQLDRLAGPRQVVGALAVDLERREGRRHLLDLADEGRQGAADRRVASGRTSLVAVTSPSASSVARASPEAQREAVVLAAVHDEGHGLGRLAQRDRQHAGGQRIERAAMAGLLRRRTGGAPLPTAGVELSPTGLSRISQPSTLARPSSCAPLASPSAPSGPSSSRRGRAPRRAGAAASSMRSASSNVRSSSKRDVRRVAQADGSRDPGAEIRRGAAHGGEPGRGSSWPPERHHEGGGVAQVGADIDLGDGDRGVAQVGIAHVAALEQLGQQMAQLLADAQLALAGRAILSRSDVRRRGMALAARPHAAQSPSRRVRASARYAMAARATLRLPRRRSIRSRRRP